MNDITAKGWLNEGWVELPINNPVPYSCRATCPHCGVRGELRIRRGKTTWETNSPYCPNCGKRVE